MLLFGKFSLNLLKYVAARYFVVMLSVDMRKLVKLELTLERFSKTAVPFASRQTLNQLAFQTRQQYLSNARSKLTLRNKFTERSIRFDKTRSLNMGTMETRAGSVQQYMATQEFGGTEVSAGKQGVAIPTNVAATGSRGTNRVKDVRSAMRRKNIRLRRKTTRAKTKAQRIRVRMIDAIKSGNRFIFLDLGRRKGIFRVVGGSRRRKVGKGVLRGAKLHMVYDLTRKSINIPRNAMLGPAVKQVALRGPRIHVRNLQFQARRLRLLQ